MFCALIINDDDSEDIINNKLEKEEITTEKDPKEEGESKQVPQVSEDPEGTTNVGKNIILMPFK